MDSIERGINPVALTIRKNIGGAEDRTPILKSRVPRLHWLGAVKNTVTA